MTKSIFIYLFVFSNILFAFSQKEEKQQQKIFVNDNQNVLLFFESPIIQGICGHTNYQFAFDLNSKSKYGIIRGIPGVISNLHVVTDDGNVYTFVLEHNKTIKKFNYFVGLKDAIGNTNGINSIKTKEIELAKKYRQEQIEDSIKQAKIKTEQKKHYKEEITGSYESPKKDESGIMYNTDKLEFYKKYCSNLSSSEGFYKRVFKQNEDILLHLIDIKYNRDELYFKVRLTNNSGINYQTNYVRFSKVAKRKTKKATAQSIDLPFLYTYNNFGDIPPQSYREAIYVIKKVGLNKDKVINIEINEEKGERNINLKLDSKLILNKY